MRSESDPASAPDKTQWVDAPDVRPRARLFDRQTTAAFLSYLAFSLLLFARGLLAHPTTTYLGQEADAQEFVWVMA